MSALSAACGVLLLALVLSLVLKKDAPVFAFLLSLAAGMLLLLHAAGMAEQALQRFAFLLRQGGIADSLYLPVLRAVGIAVVVRIMAALCKDAGQSALAAQIEIVGVVLSLSACMPLLEQVLVLLAEWTA